MKSSSRPVTPPDGAQIAPMGIRRRGELVVIAPFRPSTTLDNLLGFGCAVVNYTDDVRVFAGCLTGRYDWPLVEAERVEHPVSRRPWPIRRWSWPISRTTRSARA